MHFTAHAQTFTGGSNQSFPVCENSTGDDLGSVLIVNDPSTVYPSDEMGVVQMPSNGTLAGSGYPIYTFPTGGTTDLSGLGVFTYTPNTGFSGNDIAIFYVNNGSGPVYDTINITVNALPMLTLLNPTDTICAGRTSVTLNFTGLSNVGPVSTILSSPGTTTAPYVPYTVPAGITSLTFDILGAAGGADNYSPGIDSTPHPGFGGRVQGYLSVTPGEVLNVFVGGQPNVAAPGDTAYGGYNGGGNAYYYPRGTGGAGGGASDIRLGGVSLANRIVVAGGGGGNGYDTYEMAGGAGGNNTGGSAMAAPGGTASGGGTQTAGGNAGFLPGWLPGSNGSLGQGGNGSNVLMGGGGISGGGGGGYYGGGGGDWNGGGGGSSYTDPSMTSLITETQAANSGNGIVSLTYNIPGTYTINWNTAALLEGFADTTASLSASPFTVSIPAAAPAGTYYGTITLTNGMTGCTSVSYPISITINPNPTVNIIAPQAVCNNAYSVADTFSGSVPGTTFNFTGNNTGFGIPAGGTNTLPSSMVSNPTNAAEVDSITVTPVAGGCTGMAQVFAITAYPTPSLSNTSLSTSVCSGSPFNYMDSSATIGDIYSYSRSMVPGITPDSSASSSSVISETLMNTTNNPITVTYLVTLTANTCTNVQDVNVTVNPIPYISSATTIAPACGTAVVNYMVHDTVAGATFTWNRNTVTGITSPARMGSGNIINDTLTNASAYPATVNYVYSAMANGCMSSMNVTEVVNPIPSLNSTLTPAPVCSGSPFTYGPASSTPGASFSWTRNTVTGISNGYGFGMDTVRETLMNTTANPVMVTYDYTVTSNGCSSALIPITVTVNPQPTLTSTLAPAAVCGNDSFTYTPASNTAGASFIWHRAVVAGISNGVGYGVGGINEQLDNTTSSAVPVTYAYTVTYNTCTSTQDVVVTVNPSPNFTSSVVLSQCDSQTFSYTPTSATAGATFSWTRAYEAGILAPARSGTGNPGEQLINTTNVNVTATYQYTATYNGCTSTPTDVMVTVHPTPKLSSGTSYAVCTNELFQYTPTSFTPSAMFTWARPEVNGISPNTSYGNGSVAETLTNNSSSAIKVQYLYEISAYGCTNPTPAHVSLTVNAGPDGSIISPDFVANVCSNTYNQSFGAVTAPATGVKYTWTATNATIYSTTPGEQYILVNFTTPGTSVITLTATGTGGCNGSSSVSVTVGSGVADNPEVIYYQGMFVCLNNEEQSYQWGYDNANTFQPTSIQGAVNQSYIDHNADFTDNNYWVITTNNGCSQKTYYNPPKATATHRIAGNTLTVYPNPVVNEINLEFSNPGSGDMQYEVVNMLGQKLLTGTAPQAALAINASSLPPACYLINCYQGGVKIATTKFVKN